MSRIIKTVDSHTEPVLVGKLRPSRFVATDFRPTGERAPALECAAPTQRIYLETVAAQAERIVAEARSQALAIARDAMARGYADGKAEGLHEATEQSSGYLEKIAEMARRARVDRDALVHSAEHELAALSLAIAAKIIRREVSLDPSLVLSVAQAALEKAVPSDSVRILVHPEDEEMVRSRWPDLRGAALFGPNWEVAGEERIERGGCIIETRGGSVDARIEAQLALVAAAFEVDPCVP